MLDRRSDPDRRSGEEVELSVSEIYRPRELGFIEDPEKVVRDEKTAAHLLGAEVVTLPHAEDGARGDH